MTLALEGFLDGLPVPLINAPFRLAGCQEHRRGDGNYAEVRLVLELTVAAFSA
jgi:hypothetical protein